MNIRKQQHTPKWSREWSSSFHCTAHNFIPITKLSDRSRSSLFLMHAYKWQKKEAITRTRWLIATHTVIELSCFNRNNISLSYQLACILVFKVIRRIFHFQYGLPVKSMRAEKILVVKMLSWVLHSYSHMVKKFLRRILCSHERFLPQCVCACGYFLSWSYWY